MKETRTAKAKSDCPTLLHYLARVLMRSNHDLVTFINDLPHVEAAARSEYSYCLVSRANLTQTSVSVQTTLASVQSISSGLEQVKTEIRQAKNVRSHSSGDRFLAVMEVNIPLFTFHVTN